MTFLAYIPLNFWTLIVWKLHALVLFHYSLIVFEKNITLSYTVPNFFNDDIGKEVDKGSVIAEISERSKGNHIAPHSELNLVKTDNINSIDRVNIPGANNTASHVVTFIIIGSSLKFKVHRQCVRKITTILIDILLSTSSFAWDCLLSILSLLSLLRLPVSADQWFDQVSRDSEGVELRIHIVLSENREKWRWAVLWRFWINLKTISWEL